MFTDIYMMLFLCIGGFMSGFIDAIAGGGGIVSVPLLLFTGIPPVAALGTNKMASVMGSFTSAVTFMHNGKVQRNIIKYLFVLALAGSFIGVMTVHQIPSDFLRPLVVILLVLITIYTLFKKNWGQSVSYRGRTTKNFLLSCLLAACIGFYDGFFGPGAGSFYMFTFLCMGFDFVVSAGNARVLNFASNFAAMCTFVYLGQVYFQYAIPMGIAMVAGAYFGSHAAMTHGASYVRPLFILMTVVLIGKQVLDLFK